MTEVATYFEGHANRQCGEHRTVGSHRAWCHDCTEWCYPELPCRGCKIPQLESLLEQTIEVLKSADRCLRYLHTYAQWTWLQAEAKPLLDKLQALKKEGA